VVDRNVWFKRLLPTMMDSASCEGTGGECGDVHATGNPPAPLTLACCTMTFCMAATEKASSSLMQREVMALAGSTTRSEMAASNVMPLRDVERERW